MKQETVEKAAKTKPNYTWRNPVLTAEHPIHTGKDSPQTKTTMKQEIISDKAQDYVSRLYAENEYPTTHSDVELDVETAFADGAHWRINSVWHNIDNELPECGKHVVNEDWFDFIAKDEKDLQRIIKKYPFKRWAYVSDLLPETKEE